MAEFAKLIELLYEAALQGDESLLQDLLLRDPLLLHRPLPALSNIPHLHVACKQGHPTFVVKVLHRHPNLAEEFNPNDKSTLLHLAAKNGHLQLVKLLVSINPELSYVRDMYGQTPVHVAAIKGQANVLEELLKSAPGAARERVWVSLDTVLHLCVKFQRLEALMRAVKMVGDAHMMNATDAMGNTILHIAVATKHLEIVEFLLSDKKLKKDSQNSNGQTAMDVFEEIRQDPSNNVDARLRLALKREKVFAAKGDLEQLKKEKRSKWIENQGNTLMIVASLIATMAFQAGLNPPGGVWQDDKDGQLAGTSVWASKFRRPYDRFFQWNTAGFVLSMGSILILISGLPFKRFYMVLIKVTMWIAVVAMACTYVFSSVTLLNSDINDKEVNVIGMFALSWIGVMGLLFIGHLIMWPVRFIKYLRNRH